MGMKNPLTQLGIEPATYRFVAQHLKHCATWVPIHIMYIQKIKVELGNPITTVSCTLRVHKLLTLVKLYNHIAKNAVNFNAEHLPCI